MRGLAELQWIETTEPTAPDILTRVVAALKGEASIASKPWQVVNPYRGLLALEEQDADFFFGRDPETCQVLDHIAFGKPKILSLIGNSGVGKSSLAQAGVVAALKRQRWPGRQDWPNAMKGSRKWAILSLRPSNQPVRALASAFVNLWFEDPTEAERFRRIEDWTRRLTGENGSLRELLEATDDQFVAHGDLPPPRIVLYVDQAEELYSASNAKDTIWFSTLLAEAVADPKFVIMLSQRSDYFGQYQKNADLYDNGLPISIPPLRLHQLSDVLEKPALVLNARFSPPVLPQAVARSAEHQPGGLPLIADLMNDVWDRMQKRGDGVLRVLDDAQILDVGKSLSDRANRFVEENQRIWQTVRRTFTLKLIQVYRNGAAFRRRVYKADCTESEWDTIERLSHPNWRLAVAGDERGTIRRARARYFALRMACPFRVD